MKIYTRSGDDGQTGMLGGIRVSKSDFRIHVIGEVDELNAFLGLACSLCGDPDIRSRILAVQHDLFAIGVMLASTSAAAETDPGKITVATTRLENEIDQDEQQLPELRQFILPGGHSSAATIHVCRTVCRRAERALIELMNSNEDSVPGSLSAYMNRLSDWLFVIARRVNQLESQEEITWNREF